MLHRLLHGDEGVFGVDAHEAALLAVDEVVAVDVGRAADVRLHAWGATVVRGVPGVPRWYGVRAVRPRLGSGIVQCEGPGGQLPCASGAYGGSQEAGTRTP